MRQYNNATMKSGFTILEVLISLMITLLIFAILLITLDPLGIFADARNRNRESDIGSLLNLVYRNVANNNGDFVCISGSIPSSTMNISDNSGGGDYHIAPCLVPDYVSSLPYDPNASNAQYTSVSDYNLQYSISISTTTDKITISAPSAEEGETISVTR